jgi:hypothetical protein
VVLHKYRPWLGGPSLRQHLNYSRGQGEKRQRFPLSKLQPTQAENSNPAFVTLGTSIPCGGVTVTLLLLSICLEKLVETWSLLVFNRVYRLEIQSVMLVFSTPL